MKLIVKAIIDTKNKDCWYSSIQMLYAFRGRTYLLKPPLSEFYAKDIGFPQKNLHFLKTYAGLVDAFPSGFSFDSHSITSNLLEQILMTKGPILAALQYMAGPHIVVLTGVEKDGTIYLNDPNRKHTPLGEQRRNIAWLIDRIDPEIQDTMLCLPR